MYAPNNQATVLFKQLVEHKDRLRVQTHTLASGATIVDAGCQCLGSFEAGLIVTRICMGGLSNVTLSMSADDPVWPTYINVTTSQPLIACLGCQYAGWNLKHEDNNKVYRAMASGPGRLKCKKEALIKELDFNDPSESAVFVLESDKLPPDALVQQIADDCGLDAANVGIVVTPTGSLAGCAQIAGRVVEVSLHQAHERKFPMDKIVDCIGTTPVPPPINDGMVAMGRTNDTILYGGYVHLFVDTDAAQAETLAQQLPSSNSRDYGKPFADIFKEYEYDFFKIDPALFSPARVTVTSIVSGESFSFGAIDKDLVRSSFGL